MRQDFDHEAGNTIAGRNARLLADEGAPLD